MINKIKEINLKSAVYLYKRLVEELTSNIRLELIGIFILSTVLGGIFFFSCIQIIGFFQIEEYMDYSYGLRDMQLMIESLVEEISEEEYSIRDKENMQRLINDYTDDNKILITDLAGNVIYKTNNTDELQVDLYEVIRDSNEMRNKLPQDWRRSESIDELTFIYPIDFNGEMTYIILKGIPYGKIEYFYDDYDIILPIVIFVSVILVLSIFFILSRKKVQYIKELSDGLAEISKGNLNFRIAKKGKDELSLLAKNINIMAESLQQQIEKERLIEVNKNELITNVSHDLRTPLTSIIGYLTIIKNKSYSTENQLDDYINIVFNKSENLKKLIEDLFEYTKVSNKGINLNKKTVILNDLIAQLIEEFIPVLEENNLEIELEIKEKKLSVLIDPDKTVRVFENLLMNAVKYSFKPGKIKVRVYKENNNAIVCVQNKGKNMLKDELLFLFERFYKVDKSRSSNNDGTGLGLAIAKSLVEVQGGNIWATCDEGDIRFLVSFNCMVDDSR